ncbi:nucleotidyltransferase family protein [Rhizobium leguminosarum]|uniref:nucleotidyltransferase family protein n=1 Tax=Rhizobium leguminosarum TaxID=384 RepID=UPI003F9B4A45
MRAKPNVSIVVLAAGAATRMSSNSGHKLLAMFDGMPLVRRSALIAKASTALSVIVVVGHRQDDIREALTGLSLHVIPNPDYRVGISSSLAAGFAAAVAEGADGVLVLLADMPGVSANNLDQLIDAFQVANGASIVCAVSQGNRGNPVILPRSLNDSVLRLRGDIGARNLIRTSGLQVIEVEMGTAALTDVDTAEAIVAAGGIPVEDC